mmetsp:Transcript_47159/g.117666  ORF Transcript_47159/g.117666 Transcript_47159/m.117666 type:complete len:87 (+) Transcript_47159:296-556(+)
MSVYVEFICLSIAHIVRTIPIKYVPSSHTHTPVAAFTHPLTCTASPSPFPLNENLPIPVATSGGTGAPSENTDVSPPDSMLCCVTS